MKSRPILFSAPMVRALLDGTKTQTRRVVKHAPTPWNPAHTAWDMTKCQNGEPGDQLWVRETFLMDKRDPTLAVMSADGFSVGKPPSDKFSDVGKHADVAKLKEHEFWVTKPSIFMPRWASRITLEITSVRVERLQDISAADALAEGARRFDDGGYSLQKYPANYYDCHHINNYADIWESINGAGSWGLNPWVWVLEFKEITPI